MNAVVDAHKEATGRSVMQELKDMIKEQERAAKLDEEALTIVAEMASAAAEARGRELQLAAAPGAPRLAGGPRCRCPCRP